MFEAIFVFTLLSGQTIQAEGELYRSYDTCMSESEAELKQMGREWQETDQQFFKSAGVVCRKVEKEGRRHGHK